MFGLDNATINKIAESLPICITAVATALTAYWSRKAGKTAELAHDVAQSNTKKIEDSKKMAAAALLGSGLVGAPSSRKILEDVLMGFNEDIDRVIAGMKDEYQRTGTISFNSNAEPKQDKSDESRVGR